MHFMNEWEIEEAVVHVDPARTPNLAQAVFTLARLVTWTNANSDGWAYWPKPARAANSLMDLIKSVDRHTPEDVTAAQVRRALAPVRAFFTRQGVDGRKVIDPPAAAPERPEADYEYAIRLRRSGKLHRWNLSGEQARAWMNDYDWAPVNPEAAFEVVRRPRDEGWETVS